MLLWKCVYMQRKSYCLVMFETLKRNWLKITHWERWHYNVKYVLLSPVWLWFSLRARSFYFFAPVNPTLTFGGFEGGPKKEIYDHLPFGAYPLSIYINPAVSLQVVEEKMTAAGLTYPVAVKPNVGMMGLMFRKINNREQLSFYHRTMTAEYILQEFVFYPLEVSVFYYRMPGKEKGTITGFVQKEVLSVTGDGISTVETLLQGLVGRPGFYLEEWKTKHRRRLTEVIPEGKKFPLSLVANLSRGARLLSLEKEKTEALHQVFDALSHASRHLFYGRYDIKCRSIGDLKTGKNFKILEFNGAGAEPHHVYGNGFSFLQACRIIVQHWQVLFAIARYNRGLGNPYPSLFQGILFTRRSNKHFNRLRKLDKKMPVFESCILALTQICLCLSGHHQAFHLS